MGREAGEEPLERGRVAEVKRGCAQRCDFVAGAVEPVTVTAGEDELGAGGSRLAGGFQTDARACTDHDNGLTGQAPQGLPGDYGCGAHDGLLGCIVTRYSMVFL